LVERHGVAVDDVRDVLVTHIHLDHAGAAGWWARRGARVHVHAVGAPHLVDPSKLLSSAERIYGDKMETLWGEVLPAPAERIVSVEHGDLLHVGGLRVEAIDTPGHARHHHVFRVDDVAFGGDATGIRLPDTSWIDLPAPPPEFDLEAWRVTLRRLREARLGTLYRTHFGPTTAVDEELERFSEILEQGAEWIREMLAQGLARDAMVEGFVERMRVRAASDGLDAATLEAYELANPRVMSVDGIARYWRKRNTAES